MATAEVSARPRKGTVCRAVHGEVQQLDGGEAEAQLEGGMVTKDLRRNNQAAETVAGPCEASKALPNVAFVCIATADDRGERWLAQSTRGVSRCWDSAHR